MVPTYDTTTHKSGWFSSGKYDIDSDTMHVPGAKHLDIDLLFTLAAQILEFTWSGQTKVLPFPQETRLASFLIVAINLQLMAQRRLVKLISKQTA